METSDTKYRGFNEALLLDAVRELEELGLTENQIYPVLHLAGAKWRSVQIRENRLNEIQDPKTSVMLQSATVAFMRSTMGANQQLAKLGHSSEFDRFMFSAISIAFGDLVNEGGTTIAKWLKAGDRQKRKVVLAFAMGASILVDSGAIDTLFHRVIQARFESADNEVAAPILLLIDRLGNAGYDCLKPVSDLSN
ncbi:MAG: hypothetical protein WCL50_06440 [Spirochaetota bacterium]